METSYFSNITTLEELNKEWKRLMLLHHPDRGGSEETTKEINSQRDKREEEIELDFVRGNNRSYDYQREAYKGRNHAQNYDFNMRDFYDQFFTNVGLDWQRLFKDFEKKYNSAKDKKYEDTIIFDDHTAEDIKKEKESHYTYYNPRYQGEPAKDIPIWIAVIAGTQEEYLRHTRTLPYETARKCRFISCAWECEGKFFSEIITTGTWYDLDLNFKLLHILKERLVR
jgi:hypothetical protein